MGRLVQRLSSGHTDRRINRTECYTCPLKKVVGNEFQTKAKKRL